MFCSGKNGPLGRPSNHIKTPILYISIWYQYRHLFAPCCHVIGGGHIMEIEMEGLRGAGLSSVWSGGVHFPSPSKENSLQQTPKSLKVPLIAEPEPAHPAVCIQSLGKGRAISILLPARRVALMQINYHIRFTLLSSTDWLPNCFRWPSLILSIG